MRPVTRVPKPGSYPYRIRVSSESDLQADLDGYTLAFPRSPNVEAAFRTREPTLRQVLYGLLDIVQGTSSDEVDDAKDTLVNRLGEEYKRAAGGLAQAYGKACNYCDQVLASEADVEHIIPKGPFPVFVLCWDNFLLACGVCNSNKHNKPPRGKATVWAGMGADEVELYDAVRAHYEWPDKNGTSYRDLVPTLYIKAAGIWKPCSDDLAIRPDFTKRAADLPSRRVLAGIPGGPSFDMQARVVPQTTEARRVVKLCGLQKDGTEGGWGISDTRMFRRTLTWFDIVQELAFLRSEDWRELFEHQWPSIIRSAPRFGFFCVWVRILDLMGATQEEDPVKGGRSVMRAFLEDADFPNTDLSHLPT